MRLWGRLDAAVQVVNVVLPYINHQQGRQNGRNCDSYAAPPLLPHLPSPPPPLLLPCFPPVLSLCVLLCLLVTNIIKMSMWLNNLLAQLSVFTSSGDAGAPTTQPAPAISGPTTTTTTIQRDVPPIAQRVMAIPEILSEILSWLSDDYVEYSLPASGARPLVRRRYTLARCGRVNRLWFSEAMRHLWTDASKSPTFSLPQAMEKITRARRQIYANLIVSANLFNVEKRNVVDHNASLRGVTFPRLKQLHLILEVRRQTVCMPMLRAPVLDEIHLHLGVYEKQDPEVWVTFDRRAMNEILSTRNPFLRRRPARKIAGQMEVRFSIRCNCNCILLTCAVPIETIPSHENTHPEGRDPSGRHDAQLLPRSDAGSCDRASAVQLSQHPRRLLHQGFHCASWSGPGNRDRFFGRKSLDNGRRSLMASDKCGLVGR